jgi:hypothetical protein
VSGVVSLARLYIQKLYLSTFEPCSLKGNERVDNGVTSKFRSGRGADNGRESKYENVGSEMRVKGKTVRRLSKGNKGKRGSKS